MINVYGTSCYDHRGYDERQSEGGNRTTQTAQREWRVELVALKPGESVARSTWLSVVSADAVSCGVQQWLKYHCTQGNAVPAPPIIGIQRSHTSSFIKSDQGPKPPVWRPKADVQFPHLWFSTLNTGAQRCSTALEKLLGQRGSRNMPRPGL